MSLNDYTALAKAALRIPRESTPRLVGKILYNFGWKSAVNMRRFAKRQKRNEPFFPAFVMISVTEACNLSCSGCWVSVNGKKALTLEQLDGILRSCKQKGSYFFGILGGEPLLHKGLLDVLEKHADCYFQLFTNGTLLTEDIALRLKRMGNVTPLISIEGMEQESDARRGKNDVFARTLAGLEACRKAKLIIGAAASICKSNYDELVRREHLDWLAAHGVHYIWYYIYRPVGAQPNVENALTREEIKGLRQFLVEQRRSAPLFVIDAYWDDQGRALCPGATGMSHHVAPSGAVEFCPPLQVSNDRLNAGGTNIVELFEQSAFLAGFRTFTASTTRGCILMEDPETMTAFLTAQQVEDTTSRGTVLQEYGRMRPCPGHDMGEEAIPEANAAYRWLKKHYFFGFGAYG